MSSINPFLLDAEIAAAVLLGIGIIFESDKYCEPVKRVAFHMVMWGVVLETIFSILLFKSDTWIADGQRSKIISLESRLAARSISDKQATDIMSRTFRFAGASFQIIPYWQNKESRDLAERIAEILQSARWQIDNPKQFTGLFGVITGVYIATDKGASQDSKDASWALVEALKANGIDALLDAENNNPYPTNKININVGIKP